MKKNILLLSILALTVCTVSVQAQGYRVNQNWINGNGNTVANVNQGGPAPTGGNLSNLHIYNQPPGSAVPQTVNQTGINGNGNKVVNVNQRPMGSGPVFQAPAFPTPNNGTQLVNLKAANYPNTALVSGNPGSSQVLNLNHIQGHNNAIVNAVQNGIGNGFATAPGLGPVINVNITLNTIVGNNNQIINLAK
jgi:hypothetical protein